MATGYFVVMTTIPSYSYVVVSCGYLDPLPRVVNTTLFCYAWIQQLKFLSRAPFDPQIRP